MIFAKAKNLQRTIQNEISSKIRRYILNQIQKSQGKPQRFAFSYSLLETWRVAISSIHLKSKYSDSLLAGENNPSGCQCECSCQYSQENLGPQQTFVRFQWWALHIFLHFWDLKIVEGVRRKTRME